MEVCQLVQKILSLDTQMEKLTHLCHKLLSLQNKEYLLEVMITLEYDIFVSCSHSRCALWMQNSSHSFSLCASRVGKRGLRLSVSLSVNRVTSLWPLGSTLSNGRGTVAIKIEYKSTCFILKLLIL
jgi:hypothetical protein